MKINKTKLFSFAFTLPKQRGRVSAFTLIELLVVIAIIAILASIALPVFSSVQERGKQTKDMSNGKQVALALKQFATDNEGQFPAREYVDLNTPYSDTTLTAITAASQSNDAFRWLFPTYLTSEDIFVVAGSTFSPSPADNIIDNTTTPSGNTLVAGECAYAYVSGLNDTSNPQMPLVADAFNNVTSPASYSTDKAQPGGVWAGRKAIVIFVDGSGSVMTCDDKTTTSPLTTIWRQGHSSGANAQDMFDTTNALAPADPWLDATATPNQVVINPE
jgi:prepilin-type N-terminal cleavage/methylation domain-containing protein